MAYAQGTDVSVEKSQSEIHKTVARYKAESYQFGMDDTGRAFVMFKMRGRLVRFLLQLPKPDEERFTHQSGSRNYLRRTDESARALWEQACRQKWRALALVIKAKLEAVESGIGTFEAEFLGNVVLPNNDSVADFMKPYIELAYSTGKTPALAAHVEEG